MPRLSDSMEEGTVVRWLKQDGQLVSAGDELVEIETDKATMTQPVEGTGTLRLVAAEGDTVAVGALIAELLTPDGGSRPVAATPLARRIAADNGVDLVDVRGSGPAGRIRRADVERAASNPAAGTSSPAARARPETPAGPTGAKGTASIEELTRLQQTVARRMSEAKATVPDFAVEVEVDMGACVALRRSLREAAGEAPIPSFNDFVLKASALALREHPRVNGSYRESHFELYSEVNVGFAVAAPDALLVPVVHGADRLSLGAIAQRARQLATRAREGETTAAELAGGTFTVSNLGGMGVDRFTAVVNPPQAAILAVGALVERPVVRDGEVVGAPTMCLRLSCDHRIIYGADAAAFLGTVRRLLEAPLGMAL